MNDIILKEFKRLLHVSRLRARLNYKELATLSGISDQMIKKYENDEKLDIPLSKYIHLLKILNVPISELIHLLNMYY